VLAPYFAANDIYPLFLTWETGPIETIVDIVCDKLKSIFMLGEETRAGGILEDMRDGVDRRVEEVAHRLVKGLWTEMRDNAEKSVSGGRGIDLLARNLLDLRDDLGAHGKALEIHVVGHSAGSILLGHLLTRIRSQDLAARDVRIASVTLYAAACSVAFAIDHYLGATKSGALDIRNMHLHYLSDANEKDDGLPTPQTLPIYGKSLLYLVSRALDDKRKMPLLGFERAIEPGPDCNDDQWNDDELATVDAWQKAWDFARLGRKQSSPNVRVGKNGKTIQATHGSFDNNIPVMEETIARIKGSALVGPVEWLDY